MPFHRLKGNKPESQRRCIQKQWKSMHVRKMVRMVVEGVPGAQGRSCVVGDFQDASRDRGRASVQSPGFQLQLLVPKTQRREQDVHPLHSGTR